MMNTLKMIAEIKSTCRNLEAEKKELVARVREIDDRLTAYRMAIDSLELTMPKEERKPEPAPAPVEKAKRKRSASAFEFNGESKTLAEWAKSSGVNEKTLRSRLRLGWSIGDAMTKEIDRRKHPRGQKVFVYDSYGNTIRQYATIGVAARELKLSESTIRSIIHNMTKEDQLKSREYYLAYAS